MTSLVYIIVCLSSFVTSLLGRNKCVKMMRGSGRSWPESEDVCRQQEGAQLISVDNQEEQTAMEEIIFNRLIQLSLLAYDVRTSNGGSGAVYGN